MTNAFYRSQKLGPGHVYISFSFQNSLSRAAWLILKQLRSRFKHRHNLMNQNQRFLCVNLHLRLKSKRSNLCRYCRRSRESIIIIRYETMTQSFQPHTIIIFVCQMIAEVLGLKQRVANVAWDAFTSSTSSCPAFRVFRLFH